MKVLNVVNINDYCWRLTTLISRDASLYCIYDYKPKWKTTQLNFSCKAANRYFRLPIFILSRQHASGWLF